MQMTIDNIILKIDLNEGVVRIWDVSGDRSLFLTITQALKIAKIIQKEIPDEHETHKNQDG